MFSKSSIIPLAAFLALLLGGCSVFDDPEDAASGGRSLDRDRELFVIHSLAETISSVELASDGSLGDVQSDIQYLGAVPNHVIRVGEELIVTLSGQNELLRLDESTLGVTARLPHGAGSNPMETTSLTEDLLITTHLLAGRVQIDDPLERSWNSPPPWTYQVGQAPQALLSLPGSNQSQVRLLVANTSFSTDPGGASPFGRGTISNMVFQVVLSDADARVDRISETPIDLEPSDFDPLLDSGSNPTVLLDAPTIGEILVVGSGLNYGPDGTGADDGVLITIDRDSLTLGERLHLGGSPGSAVLLAEEPGHRLYVAGPTGIRSIYHDGNSWRQEVREEYDATGGGSALPFIADIAAYENTLYAADFANNAILIFSIRGDGPLSQRGAVDVSQGPIALLVDLE